MKNSGTPDARAESSHQFSGEKDDTQSSDYFMLTHFICDLCDALQKTVEACSKKDKYAPPAFWVNGRMEDPAISMKTRFYFETYASDLSNPDARMVEFGDYLQKLIALNMMLDDMTIEQTQSPSGKPFEMSAEDPVMFVHFIYRLMNRFDLECLDTKPKNKVEAPHPFVNAAQPVPAVTREYLSFSIKKLQDFADAISLRQRPMEHAQEQRFNPKSYAFTFN